MTIRLSAPQASLLRDIYKAGSRGVFKSTSYTPADILVANAYAKWARKFDNGRSGTLVITKRGIDFSEGRL
ncbi:hypothetical protein [Rhizobium nepotum]|uniref:hypothetical protein n=1 Tax=Rhizobium nepotum TaxID=1035271 RepID=UPI003CF5AB56